MPLLDAVVNSCRIRLRPILMTSLATIFGLIPMALKLGTGSEAYAPLARAIIGGLIVSVALTVFIVPAAYLLVYRRRDAPRRRRCGHDARIAHRSRCRRCVAGASPAAAQPAPAAVAAATPRRARCRIIPQMLAGQYAAHAAGEVVREVRVGVLSDRVRQRHRRRGAGRQPHRGRRPEQPDHPRPLRRRRLRLAAGDRLRPHAAISCRRRRCARRRCSRTSVDRRADVLLRVDRAYFNALRAQAMLRVAQETVSARQLVVDQVTRSPRAT